MLVRFVLLLSFSLCVGTGYPEYYSVEGYDDGEGTTCPCDQELSRWDKVFVMLEDSQMRQNMLLSSVKENLPGLVGALQAEVRQEAELRRQWLRQVQGLDLRLRAVEGRLERAGSPASPPGPEEGCPSPRAPKPQIATKTPAKDLPAGCQGAMMLSKPFPVDRRDLLAFTACLWAKTSGTTIRTILLTYCSRGSGSHFQLSLSHGQACFAVGPTEVKVRAGHARRWTHYCGIWDGAQRNVVLVVDGKVAADSPAGGARAIPGGGAVRLGVGCQAGAHSTSFAGKMAGFNLWDTAIAGVEAVRLLRSRGCNVNGTLVGMGAPRVSVDHKTLPH
ncbi:pentraxin-related protein PTX3-like [Mobula birostris]|uniref:pentraxin-related protein PTX3-like n=1 Tax=Mobula birostris TaxID=1983395 RepID=UPI003B28C1BA